MFHVHLRKRWNPLSLGEMPCRYHLGLTGLFYHLKLVFPPNFLFGWSIHRWEWGIKLPNYYCVNCLLSLSYLLAFALCIELLLCWVHIYLKLLYLLVELILWSLCSIYLCLLSQSLFQRSIFSYMSTVTPALSWSPFAWNIFF